MLRNLFTLDLSVAKSSRHLCATTTILTFNHRYSTNHSISNLNPQNSKSSSSYSYLSDKGHIGSTACNNNVDYNANLTGNAGLIKSHVNAGKELGLIRRHFSLGRVGYQAEKSNVKPNVDMYGNVITPKGRLRLKLETAIGRRSTRGGREYNEDRFKVEYLGNKLYYFGVFDGHNGAQAADFVNSHLHTKIPQDDSMSLAKRLRIAFEETDKEFTKVAEEKKYASGSTATVGLIRGNELVIGHVGDSRAVLCTDGMAHGLTQDHRPAAIEERLRIEASGGKVFSNRLNGVLAMSRAFGDISLKEKGLIATPDIIVRHFDEKDNFLLLATDGVFEVMTNQAAVDIIKKCRTPVDAAAELVKEAIAQESGDNITAVVISLPGWGRHGDVDYSSFIQKNRIEQIFGHNVQIPGHLVQNAVSENQERKDIIEKLFQMFDTSGDGRLNRAEIQHGMSILGHSISDEELDEILIFARDGLITQKDFERAVTERSRIKMPQ